MTNPFDSDPGYQAMVKIGKPDLQIHLLDPDDSSARAEAEVAMMDWLAEKHDQLEVIHRDDWLVATWNAWDGEWDIYESASTRAEALIAAVLATGE